MPLKEFRFLWDGDALVPSTAFWHREADKVFTVGQHYTIAEVQQRSHKAHARYFASIRDAWESLPDHMLEQFPTTEALRKYGLLKAGYRDHKMYVAKSRKEAERFAAWIKDEFAVIEIIDKTVNVWTAQSQNYESMDKETFAESVERVLYVIAQLLQVSQEDLRHAASS